MSAWDETDGSLMMGYTIREATYADLPALLALESAFPTDRLDEAAFSKQLASQAAEVFVADGAGHVRGYCILHLKRGRKALRLFSIIVDERLRSSGIGSALMDHAERWGQAHGFAELYLEVRPDNEAAHRFYMNRDYIRNGAYYGFYSDGAKALRFRKPL